VLPGTAGSPAVESAVGAVVEAVVETVVGAVIDLAAEGEANGRARAAAHVTVIEETRYSRIPQILDIVRLTCPFRT
jgi:hypothetical protein